MLRMHGLRGAASALAAGGCGLAALAQDGRVDQIERAEIEWGETEIELQTIHVPASNDEASASSANLTLERGIARFLSLGIEIETEAEDGEALDIDSVGLQAKWVVDPEAAVRFGVQTGLFVTPDEGEVGSETFLIAETEAGGLALVANAAIETEPGDWSEANAAYGLRADYPAGEQLMLGLEAGGGLSGEGAGAHWLGPVLSLLPPEGAKRPAVELSVFLPLTQETPDVQFRIELDHAF